MACRFDPLEKICPTRECWKVKIRVVRLWYVPHFNNAKSINGIEMVFMDECGSTIQASVRKTLIYKFKPLLNEGGVYIITYFGVGGNTGNFRTTKHEYRLNFEFRTTVKPAESDDIPLYGCKLTPFDEILQTHGDFPFLVDVIGLLTSVGSEKEYERDGKRIKMIIIELDSENVKLEVTLFGSYVDEVHNFIANGDTHQAIVVVQYAKVKTFKGKVVLQNVMYGTRILFNPEIPETSEFKNRISVHLGDGSQSFTIMPDLQSYSLEDDFLHGTPRKSIEELKDCKDDGLYIVYVTVKSVTNGTDWWYTACKCNKSVVADSGMYYCERCYCHVVHVVPRYRIKVRAIDDTDSASFVIWDRDGSTILKKSCSELLEYHQSRGGSHGPPDEFEEFFIEKSFLFKVQLKNTVVNQFEPCFKFSRVCNDETILSKFKESAADFILSEPDVTVGVNIADTSLSNEIPDVQSVVAKDSNCQKLFEYNSSLIACQDLNSQFLDGDADVEFANYTPDKRSLDDMIGIFDADGSSSKLKNVKIEKD